MGQRAIRSWISRHSYHSAGQIVKNKKLDHRVIALCESVRQDRNRRFIHATLSTAPGFNRLCVNCIALTEPCPLTNLVFVIAGQAFVKIILGLQALAPENVR